MSVLRTALCVLLVGTATARGAPELPPLTPEALESVTAYLRDPAANAKTFLDSARQQGVEMNPMHALLLGDAAIRAGRYRTASEFFGEVRQAGLSSVAELGMAWASLGRGQLTDAYAHLGVAGSLDPALQPATDFAMALVAAASGSRERRATLAAAQARNEPAFREVAPLLDAYARYWAGDAAGAADAFMAFAVAHPDGRFADDAFYAAAQAKRRAGRTDEADADLEALAGDPPWRGRLSSRLVALDGRALLREGMRRDRDRPTRLFPRRLADLLDGDGVRLAQAALAGRRVPEEPDATDEASAAAGDRVAGQATHEREAETPGPATHPAGTTAPAPRNASMPVPLATDARGARFPWTVVVALAAALVLLALWLRARSGRPDQARSP